MCLALEQKRTGDGKSEGVEVGATRKAGADGHAGVGVSAFAAGKRVGDDTEVAAANLVSSNRKAEPLGRSSALALALGAFASVASLPVVTRHAQIKFGMTHVHDNRIYFNGSYDEGADVIVAGELPNTTNRQTAPGSLPAPPAGMSPGAGPV